MPNPYLLRATDLIGEVVSNSRGEPVGFIEDLMVNVESGTILYVVVAHGGLWGIGSKLFALPVSTLEADPFGRGFILNVQSEQLDQSSGFDKDNWPECPLPPP